MREEGLVKAKKPRPWAVFLSLLPAASQPDQKLPVWDLWRTSRAANGHAVGSTNSVHCGTTTTRPRSTSRPVAPPTSPRRSFSCSGLSFPERVSLQAPPAHLYLDSDLPPLPDLRGPCNTPDTEDSMPRPKKKGTGPPKTRSRFGCWQCKKRKVKCGEEKPVCKNCQKTREPCDYSIQLKWTTDARPDDGPPSSLVAKSMPTTPSTIKFPPADVFSHPTTPNPGQQTVNAINAPTSPARHGRSRSNNDAAIVMQAQAARRNSALAPGLGAFQGEVLQPPPPKRGAAPRPQYLTTTWSNSVPLVPEDTKGNFSLPLEREQDAGAGYVTSPDRSKRIRIGAMAAQGDLKIPIYEHQRSPSPSAQLYESKPLSIISPSSGSDDFNHGARLVPPRALPVSTLVERAQRPGMKFQTETSTFFGYDTGAPDLDIPKNDDLHAIVGSPSQANATFGENRRMLTINFDKYYSERVPIEIPNRLFPLPTKLTNNNMNLLYFHHFLNHTARILIPYDCPINPYRTVLPQMAVEDDDLLNLMLAYSACHRARLLRGEEPVTRIAQWTQNVFKNLSVALMHPGQLTITNVASWIMLASLEIISPRAFGVDIMWRRYLSSCHIVFNTLGRGAGTPERQKQQFFLARWYGYLDVMGSLSGPASAPPLDFDVYWVDDPNAPPLPPPPPRPPRKVKKKKPDGKDEGEVEEPTKDDVIDCFLGCTLRCMRLLSEAAKMVKEAQPSRMDANGRLKPGWAPPPGLALRAGVLLSQLHLSCQRPALTCMHESGEGRSAADGHGHLSGGSGDRGVSSPAPSSQGGGGSAAAIAAAKIDEIRSTNLLYHWAGVIQVHRRVLNSAPESAQVRIAVGAVLAQLETIRAGSPAEACLLFPIFTAGCETSDPEEQMRFKRKIGDIEGFGMKQVSSFLPLMVRGLTSVDHEGARVARKGVGDEKAVGRPGRGRVHRINTPIFFPYPHPPVF